MLSYRPANLKSLLALLAVVTSCGGGLSPEEAKRLFETANSTVHLVHLDWFATMPPPSTFQYTCSAGVIDLAASDGESGRNIAHLFRDCEVQGLRISGNLDYHNARRCMPSGVDIGIAGVLEVDVGIIGECEVDVHEDCSGKFTGDVCGTDPSDFTSADI